MWEKRYSPQIWTFIFSFFVFSPCFLLLFSQCFLLCYLCLCESCPCASPNKTVGDNVTHIVRRWLFCFVYLNILNKWVVIDNVHNFWTQATGWSINHFLVDTIHRMWHTYFAANINYIRKFACQGFQKYYDFICSLTFQL